MSACATCSGSGTVIPFEGEDPVACPTCEGRSASRPGTREFTVNVQIRVAVSGDEGQDADTEDVLDVLRWHLDTDDCPEDIRVNQGIDVSAYDVRSVTQIYGRWHVEP